MDTGSVILSTIANEGPLENLDDLISTVRRNGADVSRNQVLNVLSGLTRDGFVKYTTPAGGGGTFHDITATRKGYAKAGVESTPTSGAVGHATRLPSMRPGDPTDFRNHPSRAEGGPVTVTKVARPVAPEPTPDERRAAWDAKWHSDGGKVKAELAAMAPETAWFAVRHMRDGMTTGEVAKAAGQSTSTSRMRLRKAEQLGWVTRRLVHASLYNWHWTDAGRAILQGRATVTSPMPLRATERPATPAPAPMAVPAPAAAPEAPDAYDSRPVTTAGYAGLYPALERWLQRRREIDQEAARLAKMGHPDIGAALRAKAEPIGPAETDDVLRLIDDIGGI